MDKRTADLGFSVGQHVGDLNEDFVPSKDQVELDRKIAYETWMLSGTQWCENEISNFLPLKVPIKYEDLSYPTIEHFYQALKSKDPAYRKAIAQCAKPGKTKFLAGKLDRMGELREDWFEINVSIMTHAQRHRIETDPEFANWLKSTRHRYVYEWNNWTDLFWGVSVYTGQGKNVLGIIIMVLRDTVFWPKRY